MHLKGKSFINFLFFKYHGITYIYLYIYIYIYELKGNILSIKKKVGRREDTYLSIYTPNLPITEREGERE